jgi:hypothetical protein
MSFGSAVAAGVAMQTFWRFVIFASVIASAFSLAAFIAGRMTIQPIPEPPIICTIANEGECMLIQGRGESLARILETYFDSTMPGWRDWSNAPTRVRMIERTAWREHATIFLETKDATGWKAYNEAVRREVARIHEAGS